MPHQARTELQHSITDMASSFWYGGTQVCDNSEAYIAFGRWVEHMLHIFRRSSGWINTLQQPTDPHLLLW